MWLEGFYIGLELFRACAHSRDITADVLSCLSHEKEQFKVKDFPQNKQKPKLN